MVPLSCSFQPISDTAAKKIFLKKCPTPLHSLFMPQYGKLFFPSVKIPPRLSTVSTIYVIASVYPILLHIIVGYLDSLLNHQLFEGQR